MYFKMSVIIISMPYKKLPYVSFSDLDFVHIYAIFLSVNK